MSILWNLLEQSSEGQSIVDLKVFGFDSESEAYQFLRAYGFDVYDESHSQALLKIFLDAKKFLNSVLEIQIDDSLIPHNVSEVIHLFSDRNRTPELCALLKVVHVIIHIRSDLRLRYLKKIVRQTVDRIEAHIQIIDNNPRLGFESDGVSLIAFERKDRKVESSLIVKLLHKAENIVQEIHDFIGVRFVTETRSEAAWVINYLLRHHLISPANLLGSRCRNSLFSFSNFKKVAEDLGLADKKFWTKEEHSRVDSLLVLPSGGSKDNVFSSKDYHSVQLTARPLIRIPVLRKGGMRGEISFFFPMEIQILDKSSYLNSRHGPSNHMEYKKKQLAAVRERVLRGGINEKA